MQSWDLWIDLLSGFDQVWAQVLWSLPYVGWILRWESLCFLLCFVAGVKCVFFCFLKCENSVTLQLLLLLVFLIILIEVWKLAFFFCFWEFFSDELMTPCSFFVMFFMNRLWDSDIHVAGRANWTLQLTSFFSHAAYVTVCHHWTNLLIRYLT